MTRVVFETHSISEDNLAGVATGWRPGVLSPSGRALAGELGARRRADRLDAVWCSDLARAVETVEIAFAESDLPRFLDWRLRECDYGELNGAPADVVHSARETYLNRSYPGGESWQQAIDRVRSALGDITSRWPDGRVLVVGHVATRWAIERQACAVSLETLAARHFCWQPGWEYDLTPPVVDALAGTRGAADVGREPPGDRDARGLDLVT